MKMNIEESLNTIFLVFKIEDKLSLTADFENSINVENKIINFSFSCDIEIIFPVNMGYIRHLYSTTK